MDFLRNIDPTGREPMVWCELWPVCSADPISATTRLFLAKAAIRVLAETATKPNPDGAASSTNFRVIKESPIQMVNASQARRILGLPGELGNVDVAIQRILFHIKGAVLHRERASGTALTLREMSGRE
jgi:hypothetical protein